MEGRERFPVLGNGSQGDDKVFGQVQSRLDQNRKLINEINQNQASRIPGRLNRNARLIGKLNSNIRRVVDADVELSLSFTGSRGHHLKLKLLPKGSLATRESGHEAETSQPSRSVSSAIFFQML